MTARSTLIRRCAALMLPALVWAGMPMVRAADEKPAEAKAAAEEKPKKAPADYRGPLPVMYKQVVSPDQRDKIYAVQERYAAQIKELQAKIDELEAARNKEIEAVLSPEQLKRLEELRAEAAAKKGPAKKPAENEAAKPAEGK